MGKDEPMRQFSDGLHTSQKCKMAPNHLGGEGEGAGASETRKSNPNPAAITGPQSGTHDVILQQHTEALNLSLP